MTDHDTMSDYDLDDEWETDEEPLPKRPRRRLVTPISATLAGALIGALGFIGGVEVQKTQDDNGTGCDRRLGGQQEGQHALRQGLRRQHHPRQDHQVLEGAGLVSSARRGASIIRALQTSGVEKPIGELAALDSAAHSRTRLPQTSWTRNRSGSKTPGPQAAPSPGCLVLGLEPARARSGGENPLPAATPPPKPPLPDLWIATT